MAFSLTANVASKVFFINVFIIVPYVCVCVCLCDWGKPLFDQVTTGLQFI